MGLNLEAHYQGSQATMGLVTIECAKLNEYNDLEFSQCAPWWPRIQWENWNDWHPLWS